MGRLKKNANQFSDMDTRRGLDDIVLSLYQTAADEFIFDKVAKGEVEDEDIEGFLKDTAKNPNIYQYLVFYLPSEGEEIVMDAVRNLEKFYDYLLNNFMESELKDYLKEKNK